MKDLGNGILISEEAEIAKDVQILPNTQIFGKVRIGSGSVVGPNSLIEDSDIGENTRINASQIYQSKIGNNVRIGPFSHIRPNSDIRDGVKIGDFVEIKNSVIGEKTSVAHLTYIGDSDIGARVNFGCGCVTVNYDGFNKYRTIVGDDVFVGCNTNLVAPIEVKSGSYIAAGSTLTKDVEKDALAIARVRQEVKPGWAAKFREIKGKKLIK